MKRLWTPWRFKYITSSSEEKCIFCAACESNDDAGRGLLYRGKSCIILLNRYPYSNGHLMIAPTLHHSSPEESDSEVIIELFSLMKTTMGILRSEYNPDGINVGMNIGSAAGAGISDHYHLHILPRWNGDTNFMTTVSETRLIPQTLENSYSQLRPKFDKIGKSI